MMDTSICSEVYTTLTIIVKIVCMNIGMTYLCTKSDDDDKWSKAGGIFGENTSVDLLLIRCFPGFKASIGIGFCKVGEIAAGSIPCCIAAGFLSEKI